MLLAAGGVGWGLLEWGAVHSAGHEVALLEREIRQSQMELALNLKEDFVSSGAATVGPYWNMSTSPQILQMPSCAAAGTAAGGRGRCPAGPRVAGEAGPAATGRQRSAVGTGSPGHRGPPAGRGRRYVGGGGRLGRAPPEVVMLRALWHLARGDKASIAEPEKLLRQVTQGIRSSCPPGITWPCSASGMAAIATAARRGASIWGGKRGPSTARSPTIICGGCRTIEAD